MRVLTGRAVEGGGPFRAVAEALYGLLRDPAAADPAALGEFRPALSRLLTGPGPGDQPVSGVDPLVVLGEGVLRLLQAPAGGAGTVVVLEDLYWADRDTLGLVEYLAPALPGSAVLVLATARTDEEQPELLRRLAGTPGVAELPLTRLAPDVVARLVAACAGGTPPAAEVVDFLVGAAEGLPFLVEELLAGLGFRHSQLCGWAATSPARTRDSRPHERISSMVRVLTPVARGNGDSPARRSTTSTRTPSRARVIAVTRPAGPAPAISTDHRSAPSYVAPFIVSPVFDTGESVGAGRRAQIRIGYGVSDSGH
jgi:hypothetical protein